MYRTACCMVMDADKLLFFAGLVNVLLVLEICAVSEIIRSANSTEIVTSKTPYATSTTRSSYAIKPSPVAAMSDRIESFSVAGYLETKRLWNTTRIINETKSFMGDSTQRTNVQTQDEDTTVLPSPTATDSTRTTVFDNSRSVGIALYESLNQGYQMESTILSGTTFNLVTVDHPTRTPQTILETEKNSTISLVFVNSFMSGNTPTTQSETTTNLATVAQPSKTTEAPWNSLQTITIFNRMGSTTLGTDLNPTNSSVFVNTTLPRNTSSSVNATDPLYKRPVDDYSLVIYSISFVIGISGNVFVLVDALRTQKKLKTNEILLIHLCVVNIFILSTLTPMVFLMKLGVSNSCHVIFSSTLLYQYAIAYTLSAISIQHHKAIASPFSPKPSGKKMVFTVVAIWVVSILQVLPMVLTDDLLPRGCLLATNKKLKIVQRKIYFPLLTFTQYLLPLGLIIVFYIKLSIFLRKARLEIERRFDSTQAVQSPRKKRDKRVVMVIVAMVTTFAICMLPQHLQFLLAEFVTENAFPFGTGVFTFYPVVIKAGLDPVIYGAVGRKLKSSACCRLRTTQNSAQNANVS